MLPSPTNTYSFYDSFVVNQDCESELYQNLADEQINLFGATVYYLPRENLTDNPIEDILYTNYNHAISIKMLLQNVEGFGAEPEFLTRFDLYISDEVKFVVSKKQWETTITEYDNTLTGEAEEFIESDGKHKRPIEGDLIYFPLTQDLYEIKFVNQEAPFYQFGQIQFYTLSAQIYSNTGNENIDIENDNVDGLIDTNKDGQDDIEEINDIEYEIGSQITLKVEKIIKSEDGVDFKKKSIVSVFRNQRLGAKSIIRTSKATVMEWDREDERLVIGNVNGKFEKGRELTLEFGDPTNWRIASDLSKLKDENNEFNSNSELQKTSEDYVDWKEPNPYGSFSGFD